MSRQFSLEVFFARVGALRRRPADPAQHRYPDLDVVEAMAVGRNLELDALEADAVAGADLALKPFAQDVVEGTTDPGN